MIGTIRPLVKAAPREHTDSAAIVAFGVGALASASVVGSVLGLLSWLLRLNQVERASLVAVPLVCVLLAVCDLWARTPTIRRQTCSTWWYAPGLASWVAWGLDLGLGFSTLRVTSLYWALIVTVMLLVPADAAPFVVAAYGLGLVLNVWLGTILVRDRRCPSDLLQRLISLQRPVRVVAAGGLCLFSGSLLAGLLT